jgi:hypothetical protein
VSSLESFDFDNDGVQEIVAQAHGVDLFAVWVLKKDKSEWKKVFERPF